MSTGSVVEVSADAVVPGFGWPVVGGAVSPTPPGWQGVKEDRPGEVEGVAQSEATSTVEHVSRETSSVAPLTMAHGLTVTIPVESAEAAATRQPTRQPDTVTPAPSQQQSVPAAPEAIDTTGRPQAAASDPTPVHRPRLPQLPHPAQVRIITIANQKGGVGKTTTAVNLAAALSLSGLSVLVIDQDPQGNASTALGIEHREGAAGIYDVLVDSRPLAEVVHACPDIPNLWVVPATIDLAGAEIELVPMVARETRLRGAVRAYLEYRERAGLPPLDYIFIDCPPSLGLLTVNALAAAGEVLVPIQCEYYALEGVQMLIRNIDLIKTHLNPELHVSTMLLTMFDGRTRLAADVVEEVRAHFTEQVLATLVPRSVRISEAPSNGQTVLTYDPNSSGSLSYLAAATELAKRAANHISTTQGDLT